MKRSVIMFSLLIGVVAFAPRGTASGEQPPAQPAVCITPPNAQGQQFLFSSDAGGKIYKEDLEGHLLGWLGTIGKKVGQFYWVHQMHCVSENELYTGEAQNWRVQHITMKPAPKSSAAR